MPLTTGSDADLPIPKRSQQHPAGFPRRGPPMPSRDRSCCRLLKKNGPRTGHLSAQVGSELSDFDRSAEPAGRRYGVLGSALAVWRHKRDQPVRLLGHDSVPVVICLHYLAAMLRPGQVGANDRDPKPAAPSRFNRPGINAPAATGYHDGVRRQFGDGLFNRRSISASPTAHYPDPHCHPLPCRSRRLRLRQCRAPVGSTPLLRHASRKSPHHHRRS